MRAAAQVTILTVIATAFLIGPATALHRTRARGQIAASHTPDDQQR